MRNALIIVLATVGVAHSVAAYIAPNPVSLFIAVLTMVIVLVLAYT